MSTLKVNNIQNLGGTVETYRYVQTLYYTSSGTFVKADYPWLNAIRVKCQGAGGGGGAANVDNTGGSGGGGGGYAEHFISDINSLAASENVTVGAGGAGGTTASGASGNPSSFGSAVVCNGGAFGLVPTNPGGAGGTISTNNDFEVAGGIGGWGGNLVGGAIGLGGHSFLGFGGANVIYGSSGNRGGGYGGGGSGGYRFPSTTRVGGSGSDGIVIVELYA